MFWIQINMLRLGAQSSFSDCAEGEKLAHALNIFNVCMGLSMVAGSPLGATGVARFGTSASLVISGTTSLAGAIAIALFYQETAAVSSTGQGRGAGRAKRRRGFSSPFAFLKLFRDSKLAKLTLIYVSQFLCDSTMELDQVFLRSHVGLDNSQMGGYMSFSEKYFFRDERRVMPANACIVVVLGPMHVLW